MRLPGEIVEIIVSVGWVVERHDTGFELKGILRSLELDDQRTGHNINCVP